MPSYHFAEHLLLRMPVKGPDNYCSGLQSFLNDPLFLSALCLASSAFYNRLQHSGFKIENLTDKEKHTLRKYVNRICFRATPFGLFSSVSLIQWGAQTVFPCPAETAYQVTSEPDQAYVMGLSQELGQSELETRPSYEGNPSLYRAGNEYRFIRTGIDETFTMRDYQLQSTDYSRILRDLISYCKSGRSRKEITDYIGQAAACSPEEAAGYFEFLTDAQLLLNRHRPTITGSNYLRHLQKHLSSSGPQPQWRIKLDRLLHTLKIPMTIRPEYFQRLNSTLRSLLRERFPYPPAEPLSVILSRRLPSARLDSQYQDSLREGLFALDVLCPKESLPAMAQFIKSFQQYFEGQSLPLLTALDPETGIGYQPPAPEGHNPLLETLPVQTGTVKENTVQWTAAHSYLLERWHQASTMGQPVIELQKEALLNLQKPDNTLPVTGLSVLFRVINGGLYLESAGGINAPALMGRFTVISPEIHSAAREMAKTQESENPEVLFAELLHLGDPHTDNINRRESIWSWEIPITAASAIDTRRQLQLSDLYVSVVNNQVLLRSAAHGKIVMPRLTSAYNHSLNKLPLFRFLADIPYQFGRSGLTLELQEFFPGLSFYPRVSYHGIILHLATWMLMEKDLKSLQERETEPLIAAFESLSRRQRFPKVFSLAEGDRQLVFYRDRREDILFFAACIKQKKTIIIKEFLIDEGSGNLLRSAQRNDFVRQFNACVLPSGPINLPVMNACKNNSARLQRKFMPGSEWLYLKVYSPRSGAGKLLLKLIPLFRRRYRHGGIKKWFFIRYDDHAPHIRLRLYVAPEDLSEILIAFKAQLEDRIHEQVIREFRIDVYSRELERYRGANIELVEDHFCASSGLVLRFLKQQPEATATYRLALFTVKEILSVFLPDPEDQSAFTERCYRQFLPEFGGGPMQVALDKKYRELSDSIQMTLNDPAYHHKSGLATAARIFKNSVKSLYASIPQKEDDAPDLLGSIIHMHLNRLFTDEPRKQEMIIYYLLYKYLRSEKARSR